MYRARSLAPALIAAVATGASLTGVTWAGAELAARGTNQAILPTLLTTGNFVGLEWPIRTDQPPVGVHVAFYVAVVAAALIAGLITLGATRRTSPRNGAAAFIGTWFGVIVGSIVAALAVFYIRGGELAVPGTGSNDQLAAMLTGFAFGGFLVGVVPACCSWVVFKIANRSRAQEYTEAMDAAEGRDLDDESMFDLAPGSNGETRPVEPGFTYPSGDVTTDGSYADVDLPPSERRTGEMTFSDVTDATGEEFGDWSSADIDKRRDEYGVQGNAATEPTADEAAYRREAS